MSNSCGEFEVRSGTLRAAFQMFDRDLSGTIDIQEFNEVQVDVFKHPAPDNNAPSSALGESTEAWLEKLRMPKKAFRSLRAFSSATRSQVSLEVAMLTLRDPRGRRPSVSWPDGAQLLGRPWGKTTRSQGKGWQRPDAKRVGGRGEGD